MNVTVNRKPNNEVELTVEVSTPELRPFLEAAAVKLSTATVIPGFRVGRAPYETVKARVGEMKIYEEALEPVVNKTFIDAIKQEKLEPVGMPKISVTKVALGSPLEYKAVVALLPDVTLAEYSVVKIKKQEANATDAEVDKVIGEIRDMRTIEVLVERPAQSGDRVKVDMEMFMDSIPLEGGQTKAAVVDLGKEMYIPGLDAEITGLVVGQKKEFTLTFPKDYGDKKLADKAVEFRVAVNQVLELKQPAVDDVFAQSVGDFKTVADLRAKAKENIVLDKQAQEVERQDNDMLAQLVEKSKFGAMPDLLRDAEIEKMITELQASIEQRGAHFDQYLMHIKKTVADLQKDFVKPADQRIKTSLVIRAVAKNESVNVTAEEITTELERLRVYYRDSKEAMARLAEPEYRDWIRANLLNRKVVELLRSKLVS